MPVNRPVFRTIGPFPAASACSGLRYQCLLCDAVTDICDCGSADHTLVGCGHAAIAFADKLKFQPPAPEPPPDAPGELDGDPQWATVAMLQVVTTQLSEIIDLLKARTLEV